MVQKTFLFVPNIPQNTPPTFYGQIFFWGGIPQDPPIAFGLHLPFIQATPLELAKVLTTKLLTDADGRQTPDDRPSHKPFWPLASKAKNEPTYGWTQLPLDIHFQTTYVERTDECTMRSQNPLHISHNLNLNEYHIFLQEFCFFIEFFIYIFFATK